MRKLLWVAALATGGVLFLLAKDQLRTSPALTPVNTIVTVEAREGKDVPSLNPGDVMAHEGRERLQVTDLTAFKGKNAALELFVLLDDASDTSVGLQFGDLRHFIEAQPPTTAVGIAYMQHGTVDIVRNVTTDHHAAAQALRLPFWSGGPSPYVSFSDLIKRWQGGAARREVVLVTSGVDSLGEPGPVNPYLNTAIEDAQRNGIVVYAVYMPSAGHAGHSFWSVNWAQSYLAQIAEETGGESYMLGFGRPVSFAPYLEEIAEHLAHQYAVTFLMKPENKGGFREVQFITEVPNAELVAAHKVYVPGSSR